MCRIEEQIIINSICYMMVMLLLPISSMFSIINYNRHTSDGKIQHSIYIAGNDVLNSCFQKNNLPFVVHVVGYVMCTGNTRDMLMDAVYLS